MRTRLAHLAARVPRDPSVLLVWVLAAHVALKLLTLPLVVQAPPYADEQYYYDAARALSNLVRDTFAFTAPDTAELERNVVGSGWFMPGMGIVLTPLFLLVPDAPEPLVRLYLGMVNPLFLLWAVRSVRKRLGPWYAVALAAFPALVPSWVLMSYTAYGDPISGLVLVVLVAHVVDLLRAAREGRAPSWVEAVQLGLLSIVLVYLRSSAAIVLVALGALTLVAVLVLGAQRWRTLATAGLAGGIFLALLAPWSLAASASLDTRVVTTTTVPISLANTFGDQDQVCFGPCDIDSFLWFRPLRYAREVARATGESEVEVQRQMSDYALRDVGPTDYATSTWHNIAYYYFIPAGFTHFIQPEGGHGPVGTVANRTVWWTTYVVYLPVLLLMLASLVRPQRRSLEAQVLDVLAKVAMLALFVQPFVHVAGSRYWTTAGPLFGFAAAGLVREVVLRQRHGTPVGESLRGTDARLSSLLLRVQQVLCAVLPITLGVLVVLTVAGLLGG